MNWRPRLVFRAFPQTVLPPCSLNWDIFSLESVGVFYNDCPQTIQEILNTVYENTNMFGPLTEEQNAHLKILQDNITFSYSMTDVIDFTYILGASSMDIIEETKQDISKLNNLQERHMVEDFLKSIVVMIKLMRGRPSVPDAVFVDLFKALVKLCGLIPCAGSAWKSKFNILQQAIKSVPDVVITSEDIIDVGTLEAASIVSIVQVNNLASTAGNRNKDFKYSRKRPVSSSSNTDSNTCSSECDSETDSHERPTIFETIGEKVLGQHGAELLVHYNTYGEKFKKKGQFSYHPGMIVNGTQVIFTLLVCSLDHLLQFKYTSVSDKYKSVIYYSEPHDFLKREDRNVLFESFFRLNNTDTNQGN